MGQLARRRFMRTMRTGPGDFPTGATGGGGQGGQQQQQQGGQQGAGGGGPPNNNQQQGNNGQQQNGQQQQNQGGQQNGSVLDAARQGAGGYDGNQGGQQQNNGQQGGQQQGPLSQDVLDAIGRTVQSAVDRHVNTLNNPGGGRSRNNQQQGGNGQQQGGQGGNGNDGGQQVHRVDQGARREARLAFREYVSDAMQGRFLSDVERQAAVQMGTAAIATWDGDGDADRFGHDVAQQVASTIKDLAKSYERLTIEGLRKQGRLKDDGQGPGAGSSPAGFTLPVGGSTGFQLPTVAGQPQRNPQQAVNNAAALAAQYNQAAGHPAPQATT